MDYKTLASQLARRCLDKGADAAEVYLEIGRNLSGKILKVAKERGADCVATACPLCQINLEAYQGPIGAAVGASCEIPVLYFTQLMGWAFGLDSKELALGDSLTPVEALLTEKVGG